MAFPYIFESNFEEGNLTTGWDSETTDTNNNLNVRHYSQLAREDTTAVGAIAPFQGAYCMEIKMGGETAAHQLIEGDLDAADGGTVWARFYLFVGKDVVATADDIFNIFEFNSAAAVERAVSLRITAATGLVEIGIGKVAGTVWATSTLQKGRWYCVEAKEVVATGGTGTGDLFVDGALVASITTLTDIANTTGSLGTKNVLSTTSGHLFFDAFVFDDLQIGPILDRYPETRLLTKTAHLFVGEGEILNVTLLVGAGTNNVLKIYDTDSAYVLGDQNLVAELENLTSSEPPIDLADVPLCVKRGAYVVLSGTNPRALVHIGRAQGYSSHGRVRQHGASRQFTQIATQ